MSPRSVFILLMSLNLLNYIDRQILFAVFPLIKQDLFLTDTQLGVLASMFMVVYMLAAPVIGFLADRTPRQIWISLSAFVWSAATVLSGFAKDYAHLLFARSAVGVGEAGFTSVSPSFVAEGFSKKKRARVLGLFGAALPIGSALGYILGGWLGPMFGWRNAFFIVGIPGALIALIVLLRLKDTRIAPKEQRPQPDAYLRLLKNKSFFYTCLAQAMATFTLGAMAAWMPSFFHRYLNFSVGGAGLTFGLITVVCGALGTFLGGYIADRLLVKTEKAYFLVSGLSFVTAIPLGAAALIVPDVNIALLCLSLAVVLIFMQSGPMNAVILSVTKLRMRSMAFALNIFIIHALGDALSPAFIGKISDGWGLKMALFCSIFFLVPASAFTVFAANHYQEEEG